MHAPHAFEHLCMQAMLPTSADAGVATGSFTFPGAWSAATDLAASAGGAAASVAAAAADVERLSRFRLITHAAAADTTPRAWPHCSAAVMHTALLLRALLLLVVQGAAAQTASAAADPFIIGMRPPTLGPGCSLRLQPCQCWRGLHVCQGRFTWVQHSSMHSTCKLFWQLRLRQVLTAPLAQYQLLASSVPRTTMQQSSTPPAAKAMRCGDLSMVLDIRPDTAELQSMYGQAFHTRCG